MMRSLWIERVAGGAGTRGVVVAGGCAVGRTRGLRAMRGVRRERRREVRVMGKGMKRWKSPSESPPFAGRDPCPSDPPKGPQRRTQGVCGSYEGTRDRSSCFQSQQRREDVVPATPSLDVLDALISTRLDLISRRTHPQVLIPSSAVHPVTLGPFEPVLIDFLLEMNVESSPSHSRFHRYTVPYYSTTICTIRPPRFLYICFLYSCPSLVNSLILPLLASSAVT
jgi:hypothetical protein